MNNISCLIKTALWPYSVLTVIIQGLGLPTGNGQVAGSSKHGNGNFGHLERRMIS